MLSREMALVEFFVSAFFWVGIHCTIILQCQTEQKTASFDLTGIFIKILYQTYEETDSTILFFVFRNDRLCGKREHYRSCYFCRRW